MLDIKTWLKGSGLPVADTCFVDEQALPFLVFIDKQDNGGSDDENCIVRHSISVEFYSSAIDNVNESKIETLFNSAAVGFLKERSWVQQDEMFMTVYDLDEIVEKARS